MKNSELLDTWELATTDRDEFLAMLENLSKATKLLELQTHAFSMYTLRTFSKNDVGGYLQGNGLSIQKDYLIDDLKTTHKADDHIIQEFLEKSYFFFSINKYVFFSSPHTIYTLTQRGGRIAGDFDKESDFRVRFYRDAGIMAYLAVKKPIPCKIVFRESEEGCKKIFAVMTNVFRPLDQFEMTTKIIEFLEKELGESEFRFGRISNFITDILFEFPQKAEDFKNVYHLKDDYIPGIRIHVSDVGDSSFIAHGTLRVEGGNGKTGSVNYLTDAEVRREHTKNNDIKVIFKDIEEKIFVEYTKVPERLMELTQIDVKHPLEMIENVAEYIKLDGSANAGKKLAKKIVEALQDQINPLINYTAYDIAEAFLEIGATVETPDMKEAKLEKLRSCFVKAVFYDYK